MSGVVSAAPGPRFTAGNWNPWKLNRGQRRTTTLLFSEKRVWFMIWFLVWCLFFSLFWFCLFFSPIFHNQTCFISISHWLHHISKIFSCELLSQKSKVPDVFTIFMDKEKIYKYEQLAFLYYIKSKAWVH